MLRSENMKVLAILGQAEALAVKTFYIETFGCQMNVHDSEKVRGTLVTKGYNEVSDALSADLVLYNTCSIRDKAEQKVFARLANFKHRKSENQKIAVLGCVAQHKGPEIFQRAPHVSLVCGSAEYNSLSQLIDRVENGERQVTGVELDTDKTFETPLTRRDNPHKAFITVIEGCNKHCAYCVVPFTRGPERSRSLKSIVAEANQLTSNGYTEIQLLGQNVNSYKDPTPPAWNFAQLLTAVGKVNGIRRVRFTTSHPRDFSSDIVQAIDAQLTLCNHVHLPVQSGSTTVLEKMYRNYTREQYLEKIDKIRLAQRNIALSTDIIVGFPGETDQQFEETLSLLEYVQYDSVFSFKYSPRSGTAAIDYENTIPEEEKSRRLAVLQQMQLRIQLRNNQHHIGKEEEVLVEGRRKKSLQWVGRTCQNRVLNFVAPTDTDDDTSLLGSYCQVLVTAAGANSLVGEMIRKTQKPERNPLRILQ